MFSREHAEELQSKPAFPHSKLEYTHTPNESEEGCCSTDGAVEVCVNGFVSVLYYEALFSSALSLVDGRIDAKRDLDQVSVRGRRTQSRSSDKHPDWGNPDDWELINDDGFVHKRKKQRRQDSLATSSDANQPPNPEDSRKNLRERKRKVILKLREKYLREISQWERLSNTLKQMEANSKTQAYEGISNMVSFIEPSSSEERSLTNSTYRRLVNDLLFQVKAQEAIIHGVSHLCDVAEALCSAQEERLKQQFINLPIWESSPCELVAGLTD